MDRRNQRQWGNYKLQYKIKKKKTENINRLIEKQMDSGTGNFRWRKEVAIWEDEEVLGWQETEESFIQID